MTKPNNLNMRLQPQKCWGCNRNNDAVTAVNGTRGPDEGSFTICFYCGMIHRFDANLIIRKATDEELEELKADIPHGREAFCTLMRAKQMIKQRIKQN